MMSAKLRRIRAELACATYILGFCLVVTVMAVNWR